MRIPINIVDAVAAGGRFCPLSCMYTNLLSYFQNTPVVVLVPLGSFSPFFCSCITACSCSLRAKYSIILEWRIPKDFSIRLSAPNAAGMRIVIANWWRCEVLAAYIFSYRLNKSIPSTSSDHQPCSARLQLLLPHGAHCLLPQSSQQSGRIDGGGKCIIKVQKSEAECILLEIESALFNGKPYISGFWLQHFRRGRATNRGACKTFRATKMKQAKKDVGLNRCLHSYLMT